MLALEANSSVSFKNSLACSNKILKWFLKEAVLYLILCIRFTVSSTNLFPFTLAISVSSIYRSSVTLGLENIILKSNNIEQ